MIKLKEVIAQLDESKYLEIEKKLIKNKAENFLSLFQSYKKNDSSDKDIREALGITTNSFYVLKTRLFDKIQESISCNMYEDQEKSIKLLLEVPEICFNKPRETAIAYLEILEKELLKFDMHSELLVVYSALKKMHLHSDKYFHFSKLYNKQVSFGLSLEKSEELLGNFCCILGQYDLSKSTESFEKLCFLKNEIINIYSLCSSKQIELIKNLIELQLIIFCPNDRSIKLNASDLIQETRVIFEKLPSTIVHKKWELVLDYLCFEYYYSINSYQSASIYYEKVNDQFEKLFLYNHIGLVAHFLISKIKFCIESNTLKDLSVANKNDVILFDAKDEVIQLSFSIYNSMIYYCHAKYKEAIDVLIDIQSEFILKNYFYQYLNIKLTLAYFYVVTESRDKAISSIKSIGKAILRKKELTGSDEYNHINYLLKAFDLLINKEPNGKYIAKQRDYIILFIANNYKKNEFLIHLIPELKSKYQI